METHHPIIDVPERSRFEWVMGEHVAVVTYRREGSVLWLNHAGVPPALGGRGLGSQLVQGVLHLIQARGEGQTRSIGVANFNDEQLEMAIDLTFVAPAVNQIELHPLLNQTELRAANARHDVLTQSWTPLALGRLTDNATVTSLAGDYGTTTDQVLLRWNLQLGNAVIIHSAKPEEIAANLDVFDFELAGEHMDAINGLHDGTRLRPDPDTYTGA